MLATYALRACSRALVMAPMPAPAPDSKAAAGGGRWLVMAIRGHLRGTSTARLSPLETGVHGEHLPRPRRTVGGEKAGRPEPYTRGHGEREAPAWTVP